ncbi:protein SODIUM POTASSIUM ROOT DEFECTIVE 2-like [Nymphaea colorata]|nr:protein SODIUM POTASSIUM ROOT DEFECTIVE 2-like [Nymphaea colorata]
MKGIDMFCSSHASTAICLSIDKNSIVRHGGLDRQNSMRKPLIPSLPANPKNFQYHRSKHTTTTSSSRSPSSKELQGHKPRRSVQLVNTSVSSCCLSGEFAIPLGRNKFPSSSCKSIQGDRHKNASEKKSISRSSRYLLSDSSILSILPDLGPLPTVLPVQPAKLQSLSKDSSTTNSSKQVVVLKVSIHCKGCEMKVRKHISRMEGVSSFSIDLATKKVTIVGDVSPLGVLQSVSRVKNAQFWSSATPSSGSAPANF